MLRRRMVIAGVAGLSVSAAAAALAARPQWMMAARQLVAAPVATPPAPASDLFATPTSLAAKLIAAAESQIGKTLWYDGAYSKIAYPGGDVPLERGVCTDVVIRAYRTALGIDLQKLVHEDMIANFAAYPARWGLSRPDSNIDHRRVPNLQTFLARQGAAMPLSARAREYQPGDIVTMILPGRLTHIALVSARKTEDGERPLCVHNIGAGARLDDVLFAFDLDGHYRFRV